MTFIATAPVKTLDHDTLIQLMIGHRIERGRVAGGSSWLVSPVGWRGARACGTLVAAGRTIDDALLEAARDALAPWRTHAAVTRLDDRGVVGRYLGPTASAARAALGALWAMLRTALTPHPAIAPRIWAT